MAGFLARFGRVNDAISRVLRMLCAVFAAIIVLTVFAQVLARYVFRAPLIWSEEIAVFAMIWAVMMGVSLGVREASHLVADFLPPSLPHLASSVLALFGHAMAVLVGLVFIIYGYEFAIVGLRRTMFSTSAPMFYVYISMPICGVLMLVFTAERLLRLAAGLDDAVTPAKDGTTV